MKKRYVIQKKTLELKSRNLSFSSVATIEETCCYEVDPLLSNSTQYTQDVKVKAFVPLLSQKLEQFSIKLGEAKAGLGLSAMEGICREIFDGTFSMKKFETYSFTLCEPQTQTTTTTTTTKTRETTNVNQKNP